MKNIKKLKLPAKAGIYYGVSALIGRGAGVIVTPILTRLLPGAEFGVYAHFLNWLSILTIPSTMELYGSNLMRAMQKRREQSQALLSSAFLVITCNILTISLLYFAFYDFFNNLSDLGALITIFIFIEIFANSIINLYLCSAKFLYRYKTVFVINLLTSLPSIPITLFLIRVYGELGILRVISHIAVNLSLAIILLFFVFKDGFNPSRSDMKALFKGALPYFPHHIALALTVRLDKLFIGSVNTALLAKYSVAMTLGSILTIALGALFSALIPWILRKISAGSEQILKKLNGSIIYILVYLSLILLSLCPEIFSLLAPAEYSDALIAVFPAALSVIPYYILTLNMTGLTHSGVGLSSSLPSFIGLTVMVLGVFLLSEYHYTLLSLVFLISYITMWISSSLIYKRHARVRLFPTFPTFFAFILLCLCSASLYFARDMLMLRIAVAIFALPPLFLDGIRLFGIIREN